MALVEPRIPTSTLSRIKFRFNNPSCVRIGVCFRDVVEQQRHLIKDSAYTHFGYSVCNTGHGTYLLKKDGYTFSHSNADDNF